MSAAREVICLRSTVTGSSVSHTEAGHDDLVGSSDGGDNAVGGGVSHKGAERGGSGNETHSEMFLTIKTK